MQYHIPNAIYNPNSPFNILGIPFFGKFLGREDATYPTSNNDGTYIQSSASRSRFVWDYGKHEHNFMHNDWCLPILYLNTGLNYYQAFYSHVKQSYEDAVHFAFSLVHLIISDDVSNPLCSCEGATQAVTLDMDFVLGKDVLCTDGKGYQEMVGYKGATPNGQWHTLQQRAASKLVTHGSHLCFLKQPDFTNIPSTPLNYRRLVDVGLSKKEAQRPIPELLARPNKNS
jgi:hypothetical protein